MVMLRIWTNAIQGSFSLQHPGHSIHLVWQKLQLEHTIQRLSYVSRKLARGLSVSVSSCVHVLFPGHRIKLCEAGNRHKVGYVSSKAWTHDLSSVRPAINSDEGLQDGMRGRACLSGLASQHFISKTVRILQDAVHPNGRISVLLQLVLCRASTAAIRGLCLENHL